MQCWYCNRRDVRRESLRCFGCSLKRRCRGLHELTSKRVNVPAHVQPWVHGVWNVILHLRHADGGDVRHESLRCFWRSLKRRCRGLLKLSGERVNLPAHVQLWVHGVWNVILQRRHADDGDVHS